ncbi:aaa family ATPase [Rhypophila sp. PSN 637]
MEPWVSRESFSTEEKMEDLREHVKTLETKLAYLESRDTAATGHHTRHDSITGRTEMTDDGLDSDQGPIRQLTNANTIFQVRYCNLTQFKNRFSENEGRYAIDVLVSGPLLGQEIREEMKLREQRAGYGSHWEQYQQLQKQQSNGARKSAAKVMASALKTATDVSSNNSDAIRAAQSSDTWIRRIRLQSPALLKIMASVQGETWSFRPRTYFRPCSSLIYFHSEMKTKLVELEERWGHLIHPDGSVTGFNPAGGLYGHSHNSQQDQQESLQDPVDNSPLALLALRCYVSFMDTEIMPQYHRFDKLDEHDAAKLGPATQIRFSDLGHLFRTGEFVYRDLDSDVPGRRDSRLGKRLWRCYGMHVADTRPSVSRADHRKYDGPAVAEDDFDIAPFHTGQAGETNSTTSSTSPSGNGAATRAPNQKTSFNPHTFIVRTYIIEYTGEGFCTVTKDFSILPYKGLRQITSLPVYPLRFAPGGSDQSFLSTAVEVGERVLHSIKVKHGTYNAWTVMRTPEATLVRDVNGVQMKHPEHVNSEILVDFAEAFQVCPAWKPRRVVLRRRTVEQVTESDEFSILWWDSPNRNKLLGETSEVVPIRTGVGMWAQNHFVSEGDGLLVQMAENDSRGIQTGRDFLRKEDIALISPRVYAYVFQERKFAQLDVRYFVDSVGANKDALNFLRIPQAVKSMIQRSVRGHLLLKDAEKRRMGEFQARTSQDFIRGKGSGLFILLHGVPGVGKTATAEAVAQTLGKPLFKITCGDLGLTPESVESSLRAIFRLASLWDTILLLDEVDTFFSQRSKGDGAITKNALVSVFLRVLDYYSGILFMTTNRAGALDEAFKSRIHYKIYYPHLNKQQTLEIWQINLDKLGQMEDDEQRLWNAPHDPQADVLDDHKLDHGDDNLLSRTRAPHRPMQIPHEQILAWAAEQFDLSRRPLNGRQIRNAVQVAKTLAYADAAAEAEQRESEALARNGGNPDTAQIILPSPRLRVEHFEMIQYLTVEFDNYIEAVFSGQSDDQLAAEKEERLDHYTPSPYPDTGWGNAPPQSSLLRYDNDHTLVDDTLSRPHSRGSVNIGAGAGVRVGAHAHGGIPLSHSPRMRSNNHTRPQVGISGNWSSGPNLTVPLSGGAGDGGLGISTPGNHQYQQHGLMLQQGQIHDSRPARVHRSSPSLHQGQTSTGLRGGQQYGTVQPGMSDNGPLPGQTQQRRMPTKLSQRDTPNENDAGFVGSQERGGESDYTFGGSGVGHARVDGSGYGIGSGDRPISPGLHVRTQLGGHPGTTDYSSTLPERLGSTRAGVY